MSHIPVQYNTRKKKATLVIENNDEDKEHVEELICKLLNIKKTKGKVSFGPSMTAEQCLIYNEGYIEGVAAKIRNVVVVDAPEVKEEKTWSRKSKRERINLEEIYYSKK